MLVPQLLLSNTHSRTRSCALTHTVCDSPSDGIMAAPNEKKRGLEHLDEYEPKPAKHLRSLHDRMAERRLVVILEGASLETVKVRASGLRKAYCCDACYEWKRHQ